MDNDSLEGEPLYKVKDARGRIVSFTEKASIILTILMVFLIIGFLGELFMAVSMLASFPQGGFVGGIVLMLQSLVALIYVFVLNHLRVKGDMDADRAEIDAVDGRRVIVVKKSSIWITIGLIIDGILVAVSLLITIIGILLTVMGGVMSYGGIALSIAGILFLIITLLVFQVLRFLRTKIDFPVENFRAQTIDGRIIEFYKSRSIWILIAMILTLISAVATIFAGISIIFGLLSPPMLEIPGGPEPMTPASTHSILGIILVIEGLLMLIPVAVLNFLRVRGHVREVLGPSQPAIRVKPGEEEESEII